MISNTSLKILELLSRGINSNESIAKASRLSEKNISRFCKRLIEQGVLKRSKGQIALTQNPHAVILLNLLTEYPHLSKVLSDSGIDILIGLLEQKTIKEISQEIPVTKNTAYKKIRGAMLLSIVTKKKNEYSINEKIWPKLKQFLDAWKQYEESHDKRLPSNSNVYLRNSKEVLFSSSTPNIDATLTAFSAFEKFNIKLYLPTTFYYFPKKQLSKEKILIHSIIIAEKENSTRYRTYTALFYLKYKKEFEEIKNSFINNLQKVLKREHIGNFPKSEELKEKCEEYDIKF